MFFSRVLYWPFWLTLCFLFLDKETTINNLSRSQLSSGPLEHRRPALIGSFTFASGLSDAGAWQRQPSHRAMWHQSETGSLMMFDDVWHLVFVTLDAFGVRYEADTLRVTPFGDIGSCLCGSHGREFYRCGSLMELVQRLIAKDSNTSVRLSTRSVGSTQCGCAVHFHYCRSGQHPKTSLQIEALRTCPCISLFYKVNQGCTILAVWLYYALLYFTVELTDLSTMTILFCMLCQAMSIDAFIFHLYNLYNYSLHDGI
jgi:hypothetical protein